MVKVCQTRAIKNAKYLQRAAPNDFPTTEPLEGFAGLISNDLLMRLQVGDQEKIDLPEVKEIIRGGGLPLAREKLAGPLFSGTVFPIHASFNAPGGPFAISEGDLRTITEYLSLSSRPISRYATQYGVNVTAISHRAVHFETMLSEPKFNDQMVSEWVDQIVAENAFSKNSCVAFLSPEGVLNVDAEPEGSLGYHSVSPTGVPYVFVNIACRDLTVNDVADYFALGLSHVIAEMVVDPRADITNPECCEPCGPNCTSAMRDFFGVDGEYMETSAEFPPPFTYNFFISAIVRPRSIAACPAPVQDCSYRPP